MAWFSILIPSWNDLPYLRLCVESLRRHSARAQGIEHTASAANIGICHAVNLAGEKARGDYVLYLNDDMVAAPG